jgi:hypothetical protein
MPMKGVNQTTLVVWSRESDLLSGEDASMDDKIEGERIRTLAIIPFNDLTRKIPKK